MGTWGYQKEKKKKKKNVLFGEIHANDIFVNNKSFWVHSKSHDRFERVLGAGNVIVCGLFNCPNVVIFALNCAKAYALFSAKQRKNQTAHNRSDYYTLDVLYEMVDEEEGSK